MTIDTVIRKPSRAAELIANSIRSGTATDPDQVARNTETANEGNATNLSRAIVISARLLALASEATGRSHPDLLDAVDPGDSVVLFGSDGWSSDEDNSGGNTISAVPRR
jgi:hypothetical protein